MFFRDPVRQSGPVPVNAGPLDHPEIRRMTPRELADLPWPRRGETFVDQRPVPFAG